MGQESIISYRQLISCRFTNEDSQQKRNALSALNGYLEFCKKNLDSEIGREILEDFDEIVERSLLGCSSDSTKYTKKSHLKKWHTFFAQQLQTKVVDVKKHNFKSFVLELLRTKGKDPYWLMKETNSKAVYHWFMDMKIQNYPSLRSKDVVCLTSKVLGLEENFLWDTFVYYPATIAKPFQRVVTEYNDRLKRVQPKDKSLNYAITSKILDSEELKTVRQESEKLFYFKTDATLPDGIHRASDDIWSKDSDGTSGSYTHFIRMMKCFLGYLHKEHNIPFSELSLRLVLRTDYVSGYMTFFERRHGFLTDTVKQLLCDMRSLVKYYIQYPKHGFPDLTLEEGKKKATEHLEYLTSKIMNSIFLQSRNPEDQIRAFLDLEDPLEPFFEALSVLKKQYAFVKREQPYLKWFNEIARDIVLLQLVLEKPIRSKNLAQLRFDKHLYKRRDGLYELFVPGVDVKNGKEIKKTLSAELSKWIDIYREQHYKKLNSRATDFVFISKKGARFTAEAISKLMGRICETLIGIETRCHSFRHLRATAYLMKHPREFLHVADMLNDDLITVMRRYAHVNGRLGSKEDDQHLQELIKKFED